MKDEFLEEVDVGSESPTILQRIAAGDKTATAECLDGLCAAKRIKSQDNSIL